jgi:citrate synthase
MKIKKKTTILIGLFYILVFFFFVFLQKVLPAIVTCVRNASDSTDLKGILLEKVPIEQERVKNFRKQHGGTKVGEVTVDMVSY